MTVIERAELRATHCPVACFAMLDVRLSEVLLALYESSKNGGNFEMFKSMQRLLLHVLAATNATTYIKLGAYDGLLWLTESEFTEIAYKVLYWLRRTKTGQTVFADLWVELQVSDDDLLPCQCI